MQKPTAKEHAPSPQRGQKKASSRQRILTTGARLFRERGLQGASVNEVMAGAGLTRGGFYAHFEDKDALVGGTLHEMFDEAERNWLLHEELRGDAWVELALKRYLSVAHLQEPGRGCVMPALSAELSRGGETQRRIVAERISTFLKLVEDKLDEHPEGASRRERAIALFTGCVGAITVARALGDPSLAAEVLNATRQQLRRR